ncbi:Uma2 family endonuclease [Amycolatopsis sp. SID8362]|uniref:Uma2 family endonuclease n=1 Tax=Amycolatopsis sp. SID8362 TaxID=2690346 RepID=UPI00136BDD1E|nr:Uma2 family endonuclease [Amycolatopsis sp. SID8362]NBH11238.1 Uma2 family endonuclease [Amycolatopsis sp. SID8362]NED47930.1 Uma2 family endonuclease [Amycolatopsis sp. SID8362]
MPDQLLSVEEYRALGETDRGFTELVEGRVVPSPGAGRAHNMAACRLAGQLERQLPRDLAFALGTDVDLGLAAPGEPGFSRRPDLLIFDRTAADPIRAEHVAVVVEIATAGSRRTDYRVKHDEYADAGIPHYWIVDLADPVTLIACQGYQDAAAVTGTFATEEPFPVKIDLDGLLSPVRTT